MTLEILSCALGRRTHLERAEWLPGKDLEIREWRRALVPDYRLFPHGMSGGSITSRQRAFVKACPDKIAIADSDLVQGPR